jgi:hypothetical protein
MEVFSPEGPPKVWLHYHAVTVLVLLCQPAWAGQKKHTFDAPAESVFEVALRVANEQHKVEYKEEQNKKFVFTTGISSLSWGMRVLATVVEVEPGKSSVTPGASQESWCAAADAVGCWRKDGRQVL